MSFASNEYDIIRDGCLRSARTIVPNIIELLKPTSVIDFGCGEGWWLSVFAEHGCEILGIDGGGGRRAIPEEYFIVRDLATAKPLFLDRVDLTMSLEVAEHLPPHRGDYLVDELCWHADTVLFSAAIPGQGGQHHINEQWPKYWADKFAERGYQCSAALRWVFWDLAPEAIENWYAQNLLLFMKDPGNLRPLFEGPGSRPYPVVHPVLWDSRR